MPPKATLDQDYHFGMFTMKAVFDGRAKELIDIAKVNLTRWPSIAAPILVLADLFWESV